MDVDTIEAGLDFVEVLENAVQSCDVLVALIGKQWLSIKDEVGKRRLDNPQDFVRIEVAAALSRNIRVIPVLVDGTPMPYSDKLPDNLQSLALRNAVPINHYSFHNDANRLIEQLELALKAAEEAKLLKAKELKEKETQKKRQAEIENLISQADIALDLHDLELAKEKLDAALILEPEHIHARVKLTIVERKLRETKEQNLAEEIAAKEKAEREAADKAEREKSAQEAVEKAAQERAEQEVAEKAANEKAIREPNRQLDKLKSQKSSFSIKTNGRAYFIGGVGILACVIIFALGNLIQSALFSAKPTATQSLPTKVSMTETLQEPEPVVTESIITSTATSDLPGFIPIYISQNDPAWKSEKVGSGDYTIGEYGSVVTCLSILLSGHGYPETPKTRGGFVDSAIVWNAVTSLYPHIVYRELVLSWNTTPPLTKIDKAIADGQPVIVEIDSSPKDGLQEHWVVLYAKTGNDYLMLDPWPYPPDNKDTLLTERYGFSAYAIPKEIITAAVFFESVLAP